MLHSQEIYKYSVCLLGVTDQVSSKYTGLKFTGGMLNKIHMVAMENGHERTAPAWPWLLQCFTPSLPRPAEEPGNLAKAAPTESGQKILCFCWLSNHTV